MDDVFPPSTDDLDLLQRLLVRVRAGQPTDRREVERAQETAFGSLIGLEAELSRRRAAGEPPGPALTEVGERIDQLRRLLTELRTLSSAPGDSRVGYGFVLPPARRGLTGRS